MKNLVREMKGYYASMYEQDNKDLESKKQVYKDKRKVNSEVKILAQMRIRWCTNTLYSSKINR